MALMQYATCLNNKLQVLVCKPCNFKVDNYIIIITGLIPESLIINCSYNLFCFGQNIHVNKLSKTAGFLLQRI